MDYSLRKRSKMNPFFFFSNYGESGNIEKGPELKRKSMGVYTTHDLRVWVSNEENVKSPDILHGSH